MTWVTLKVSHRVCDVRFSRRDFPKVPRGVWEPIEQVRQVTLVITGVPRTGEPGLSLQSLVPLCIQVIALKSMVGPVHQPCGS